MTWRLVSRQDSTYTQRTLSQVPCIEKDITEIQMAVFLPIHKESLDEIHMESMRDVTIQALQAVIQDGWPETKTNLSYHAVLPYPR